MANFVRRTTLTINGKRSPVIDSTTTKQVYHGENLDENELHTLLETIKTQISTLNGYFENGTAKTAKKLSTARTIALKGGVSGSGSFDGSGNLSIQTTVDSVPATAISGVLATSNIPAHTHIISWGDINNKPTTYAPSSHTHQGSDIKSIVSSAVNAEYLVLDGSGQPITVSLMKDEWDNTYPPNYIIGAEDIGDGYNLYYINPQDYIYAKMAYRLVNGFNISINGTSKKLYGNGDTASFTIAASSSSDSARFLTADNVVQASADGGYSERGCDGDEQYFTTNPRSIPTGLFFIKFMMSSLKPNVFLNNKRISYKGNFTLCENFSCPAFDNYDWTHTGAHYCEKGISANKLYLATYNGSTYNIVTEV